MVDLELAKNSPTEEPVMQPISNHTIQPDLSNYIQQAIKLDNFMQPELDSKTIKPDLSNRAIFHLVKLEITKRRHGYFGNRDPFS